MFNDLQKDDICVLLQIYDVKRSMGNYFILEKEDYSLYNYEKEVLF